MTLTKTQIFHRTDDLSGEIKAARTAQSECRLALSDQERLTAIAAQALERADARVAELEAERADLAEQARQAILQVGDPPPLAIEDGAAPEMIVLADCGHAAPCDAGGCTHADFWHPTVEGADFQAQALENGLSRITDAFNRSTQ